MTLKKRLTVTNFGTNACPFSSRAAAAQCPFKTNALDGPVSGNSVLPLEPYPDLPAAFSPWDDMATSLPDLMRNSVSVRHTLQQMAVLDARTLEDAQLPIANVILTRLATVWWNCESGEEGPPPELPACIAEPLEHVQARLQRDKTTVALLDSIFANFTLKDPGKAPTIDNIRLRYPIFGSDEERFFLGTVIEMAEKAKGLLKGMRDAENAVDNHNDAALETALHTMATSARQIADSFSKLSSREGDPYYISPSIWALTIGDLFRTKSGFENVTGGIDFPYLMWADLFLNRKAYDSEFGQHHTYTARHLPKGHFDIGSKVKRSVPAYIAASKSERLKTALATTKNALALFYNAHIAKSTPIIDIAISIGRTESSAGTKVETGYTEMIHRSLEERQLKSDFEITNIQKSEVSPGGLCTLTITVKGHYEAIIRPGDRLLVSADGESRLYSIGALYHAEAAVPSTCIQLTVKRHEHGKLSQLLTDPACKVPFKVAFSPNYKLPALPKDVPLIFVAMGSGIGGMRGLIQEAALRGQRSIVYASFKNAADVPQEFKKLESADCCTVNVTITNDRDSPQGSKRQNFKTLGERHQRELKDGAHVFVCGSKRFAQDVCQGLGDSGELLAQQRLHVESHDCQAPVGKKVRQIDNTELIKNSWTVINGAVYDLASYIATNEHPGGQEILKAYAGKDATILFEQSGAHKGFLPKLRPYYLGEYSPPKEEAEHALQNALISALNDIRLSQATITKDDGLVDDLFLLRAAVRMLDRFASRLEQLSKTSEKAATETSGIWKPIKSALPNLSEKQLQKWAKERKSSEALRKELKETLSSAYLLVDQLARKLAT